MGSGRTDSLMIKITLESEAIKYLEYGSTLVSDFGRYGRFEADGRPGIDLASFTLFGTAVLVDSKHDEPNKAATQFSGSFVRPGELF
jgi:hypothetical protein